MIGATDLDDSLLLGRAARHADGAHDGLGAAAEHTEFLDVGHALVDLLRDEELRLMEQTGHGAAVLDELDRLFLDGGIVAAQDGGTASLQEVDILVAVKVVHVRAFSLDDAHGERLVESEVVLHAAGDVLLRLRGDGFGLGALLVVVVLADVLISLLGDAVNGLGGELFQALIDLLCVSPASDAVTGFLFALKFGISDFHFALRINFLTLKLYQRFSAL